MPKNTHINVTVDFGEWCSEAYDVRIPVHQTIKQLLLNLVGTVQPNIPEMRNMTRFAVKVPTKDLLLTDDDRLEESHVTDGDILIVL